MARLAGDALAAAILVGLLLVALLAFDFADFVLGTAADILALLFVPADRGALDPRALRRVPPLPAGAAARFFVPRVAPRAARLPREGGLPACCRRDGKR